MSTPSRERGADEGTDTGFFSRLFSTAKKPRTVERHTEPTSPQPRLILSPTNVASPLATANANANNNATALNAAAATATTNGTTSATATATEWRPHPALVNFHIGAPGTVTLQPYRRRRIPTRPNSYTLVGRSRNRPPPTEWDASAFQNIMQSNRSLFVRPNEDDVAAIRIPGATRILGSNQRASRMPPPAERAPRVSFVETRQVSFVSQAQQTPSAASSKPRLKRQQTPGTRQQPTTPAIMPPTISSPPSTYTTGSTPAMVPRRPRTDFHRVGPHELDGEVEMPLASGGKAVNPIMPMMKIGNRYALPFKQERFVRVKKEVYEQAAQTKYTVDDDDEEEAPVYGAPETKKPKTSGQEQDKTLTAIGIGWAGTAMTKNLEQQRTNWTCLSCTASNEQDKFKCPACDIQRPGYEAEAHAEKAAPSTSGASFSFGVTAAAPTVSLGVNAPATGGGFSFGVSPPPATGGGFSFGVGPPPPATGGFTFGQKDDSSDSKPVATPHKIAFGAVPQTEPATKKRSMADSAPEAPKTDVKPAGGSTFNFGSFGGGTASASSSAPGGTFSFGSAEAKPAEDSKQPALTFPLAVPTEDDDESRRKKRRGRDEDTPVSGGFPFGAPVAPAAAAPATPAAPAFTFGAPAAAPAQAAAAPPATPAFTFGSSAAADTPAASKPSVTFGATPSASESTPAFNFGAGSSTPGANGGSNPFAGHTPGPSTNQFPSTPVPSFGGFGGSSTPAATTNTFHAGSTPAPPTFGGGIATPAPPANTFNAGSTPGPPAGFGAGSTPAPPAFGAAPSYSGAPAAGGFGAAPAVSFGAAPAAVSFAPPPAAVSFGAAPGFGAAPPAPGFRAAPPAPGFGGTPAQPISSSFGANTAPPANNFGGGMATPAAGGFSMGTSAKSTGRGGRRIVRAKRPNK
jgi:hypothetical protein